MSALQDSRSSLRAHQLTNAQIKLLEKILTAHFTAEEKIEFFNYADQLIANQKRKESHNAEV